MSDDDMTSDGRRGGRPKGPVPHSKASTWIPVADHDQLIRIAQARGQSLSATVADLVRRHLERDEV
jgi:hypothetical protein